MTKIFQKNHLNTKSGRAEAVCKALLGVVKKSVNCLDMLCYSCCNCSEVEAFIKQMLN